MSRLCANRRQFSAMFREEIFSGFGQVWVYLNQRVRLAEVRGRNWRVDEVGLDRRVCDSCFYAIPGFKIRTWGAYSNS